MKNWQVLLICLLVSSGIWMVMNLSRMNTDVESVKVLAVSNIDGYASESSEGVTITARCKASGFRLISLGANSEPIRVSIDAGDLQPEDSDCFSIDATKLYRYVPDIFGQGVNIESFLTTKAVFKFTPVNYKKVPVVPVKYTDFRPQYMASGPMKLEPDSVLVYGENSKLVLIDKVMSEPLALRDVHRDERGVLKLETPKDVRLSNEIVEYFLPVSRYVELRADMKVSANGAPEKSSLAIFPSIVSVTFRCEFPLKADPTEISSAKIDYRKFRHSATGQCVVYIDNLPDGVIDVRIDPQVCECVESRL